MFTLILRDIPLPPSQGGDRTNHPLQTAKRIRKARKASLESQEEKHSTNTSTSTSKAMLSPPLEDRPLVEEREEFFALSREEEKAV